ncbi:hypothetical protein ASPWEDRAFT_191122 [Aspergillus wentii DTO 134E9]|uniref:Mediator of RNA polymerase II transcription subunit 4 n=1 Tax=Aspergillus wentii DTO 134E9 TaxID=1073089 RepID=A0A1L9RZ37_ASPWE|nr:uncharacterized protein ASPWEDRAFT_191122 [Aspergillus wentii DTO 134E9]KAI9932512.1 hypothetical protein MW887_008754 [Aspergillus wentii]OJJ40078.1 hypothetical protein ASPWEDRAFT_191122 [Aspergillus wentii DTO 134E9]
MDAHVRSSLSNLENKLNSLINSLTTTPTAAGAPAAAVALLEADDQLTSAVQTLRQHQENYAKILRLRAEAENLEERVKGVVRDIEGYEKQIGTVCGDESDSDSDLDDSSEEESEEGENKSKKLSFRRNKDVDYKLLLDFARRISKYNHQAAADAAAGNTPSKKDKDVAMTGMNGATGTEEGAEPVSSVTKDATLWLDESANMTREVYMLPYPMEDRIRMGLMGQIQLAAAEGRPGFESDKEVERMIREAEGLGVADAVAPTQAGDETRHADEAAMAAAQAGSVAPSAVPKAAPPPKPQATLDLDLYDPDDDDI